MLGLGVSLFSRVIPGDDVIPFLSQFRADCRTDAANAACNESYYFFCHFFYTPQKKIVTLSISGNIARQAQDDNRIVN